MKRTCLLFIILTIIAVSLTACQEEEKKVIETMTSGFMTGYTNHDGQIYKLVDDFGEQYYITEKGKSFTPDSTYRLLVSIALKDNGTARILQLEDRFPSYYAPEDSTLNDSVKVKDPLKIFTAYIGGGYLNITIGIKVEKEHTKHKVDYSHMDDSLYTSFTLYHNAFGDGQVYTKNTCVSIPLTNYALKKNDTVSISYNGYEGDSIMKLVYR